MIRILFICLVNWLIDWVGHRSIDWLIDWLIDWIDWLIGLIDWLIGLIDWLIGGADWFDSWMDRRECKFLRHSYFSPVFTASSSFVFKFYFSDLDVRRGDGLLGLVRVPSPFAADAAAVHFERRTRRIFRLRKGQRCDFGVYHGEVSRFRGSRCTGPDKSGSVAFFSAPFYFFVFGSFFLCDYTAWEKKEYKCPVSCFEFEFISSFQLAAVSFYFLSVKYGEEK